MKTFENLKLEQKSSAMEKMNEKRSMKLLNQFKNDMDDEKEKSDNVHKQLMEIMEDNKKRSYEDKMSMIEISRKLKKKITYNDQVKRREISEQAKNVRFLTLFINLFFLNRTLLH